VLDLAPARHVEIGGPVEIVAAMPQRAIRVLDPRGDVAESMRGEDLLHPREAQTLLLPRQLGSVGDQGLPEIEGDGS
jgi:hypothetical protein